MVIVVMIWLILYKILITINNKYDIAFGHEPLDDDNDDDDWCFTANFVHMVG